MLVHGHEACLRELHELGVKAAADKDGRTPAHFAADGHEACLAHFAAAEGHEACLRALTELGVDEVPWRPVVLVGPGVSELFFAELFFAGVFIGLSIYLMQQGFALAYVLGATPILPIQVKLH